MMKQSVLISEVTSFLIVKKYILRREEASKVSSLKGLIKGFPCSSMDHESPTLLIYMYMYLQSSNIFSKEVIRRTSTPVHNVFVLTATAQLAVPISDTQVGLHEGVTHGTITEHSMEE